MKASEYPNARTPLVGLLIAVLALASVACGGRSFFLAGLQTAQAVASSPKRSEGGKPDPTSFTSQSSAPEYATLVGSYCVTCHSDRLKTAGLTLQGLGLTDIPEHAQVWEKVMRKLRSGEMPPATVRSRPDPQVAGSFVTYLEATMDRAAVTNPSPGRA